jgi:hypothetical protein
LARGVRFHGHADLQLLNNDIDYRIGANENLGSGIAAKGTYTRCRNERTVNEDTGTGSNPPAGTAAT